MLRSAFYWEERDQPFQVIFRRVPLSWTILDWSDADELETVKRLIDLKSANRKAPFDLRKPPLLQLQWIRLKEEKSILLVSFHHIVLDGWSLKQLFNEAGQLYLREIGADAPALPKARHYSNYIGWLKQQDRQAALGFWKVYLADIPGPVRLLQNGNADGFERLRWECPPALLQKLKTFCEALGITLNTLLQGALGLLMARQTGRHDVIFGTTTSGRPANLPGSTTMVGLFINTLPVRVTIDPHQTMQQWLVALQARQAATTEHEHVPLR